MSGQWVDFRELRQKLHFSQLLDHFHVELKVKGDKATGLCPLPGHPRHEGKRSPSFSAHLGRGIFNCFGCGAHGNCIDFAALMSGVDPKNSAAFRKVALELQERFLGNGDRYDHQRGEPARSPPTSSKSQGTPPNGEAQEKPDEGQARPVIANAPLDFSLKMLDVEHPYLKQRGLTLKTISHFGVGYCSRGLMQGRIAIPLHDATGNLVGYAGRLVDDSQISEDNPKYRFPGERERDGKLFAFRKKLLLYNAHRITAPVTDLVIVEGFASVWHLWALGCCNVAALMGSSCSAEQVELICNLVTEDAHVWAFADGDDAGVRCAHSLLAQTAPRRFVRWVRLEDGRQPTDCDLDELARRLPPALIAGKEVAHAA
jgi:DNA primase